MRLRETEFLTHEIGSLRKPNYFVKLAKGVTPSMADVKELQGIFELSKKDEEFNELRARFLSLREHGIRDEEDRQFLKEIRVALNVWFKESTGIDVIDAGEWLRREMYQYVIEHKSFSGIKLLGHIRSFDQNFYRPGVYTGKIMFDKKNPIHLEELTIAKRIAKKPVKLCLTSFNTIAEWTYEGWGSFEDMLFELIDEYYIPEVKTILRSGVDWIQLDEPALTTNPSRMPLFVEAWNYFIEKIKSDLSPNTLIGIHNCFSNYDLLFPILPELNRLDTLSLEYANRDTWELGRTPKERRSYYKAQKLIRMAYENGFNGKLCLGVVPVHTTRTPSPELIRDRVLTVTKILGDAKRVLVCPDCGLRTRTLPQAHQLLQNMVRGTKLAKDELH